MRRGRMEAMYKYKRMLAPHLDRFVSKRVVHLFIFALRSSKIEVYDLR